MDHLPRMEAIAAEILNGRIDYGIRASLKCGNDPETGTSQMNVIIHLLIYEEYESFKRQYKKETKCRRMIRAVFPEWASGYDSHIEFQYTQIPLTEYSKAMRKKRKKKEKKKLNKEANEFQKKKEDEAFPNLDDLLPIGEDLPPIGE